MKNQCKIDARKSDAKIMENQAKMEPEWEPTSMNNQKKGDRKSMRKLMRKIIEKIQVAFLEVHGAKRQSNQQDYLR